MLQEDIFHWNYKFPLTICFYLAVYCSDPSANLSLAFQKLTSGPTISTPLTEGAMLNISCVIGYVWTGGQEIRSIICTQDGIWTPTLPICTGILNISRHSKTFYPNFLQDKLNYLF